MKRIKLFLPGLGLALIGGACAKWLSAEAGIIIIGAAGWYFGWIREQAAFARSKPAPTPSDPTEAKTPPASAR